MDTLPFLMVPLIQWQIVKHKTYDIEIDLNIATKFINCQT